MSCPYRGARSLADPSQTQISLSLNSFHFSRLKSLQILRLSQNGRYDAQRSQRGGLAAQTIVTESGQNKTFFTHESQFCSREIAFRTYRNHCRRVRFQRIRPAPKDADER